MELQGILKRSIVFTEPSNYLIKVFQLSQLNENNILSTRKDFTKKNAKAWKLLFAVMLNLFC